MSLKDLEDISKKVFSKRNQEKQRLESERKQEYSNIVDGIVDKKNADREQSRKDRRDSFFKRHHRLIKVIFVVSSSSFVVFQIFFYFGRKDDKPEFIGYKPSYVLVEDDETEDVKLFIRNVMISYEKDGESGIEKLWDENLPDYIIKNSISKLAAIKNIKDLELKKVILEKSLSSYLIHYANPEGRGIIFRAAGQSNRSFRLTGIE